MDEAGLRRVYQHVFLPPQLPQSAEENTNLDNILCESTIKVLKAFPGPPTAAITNAITAIKNLRDVSEDFATHFRQTLNVLADGNTVPVNIQSQNAGILITREHNDLIFESFELSPTNSAVMATKGRLTRCFPSVAIAVDTEKHPSHELNPVIAQTLHTLAKEGTPEMQSQSWKAGTQHREHRDTTNPAMVTEMFFGFLRGFGKTVSVSSVSKQTRDEVLWEDALAPWRRSPTWLFIKVTLHLIMTRAHDGSDHIYKGFMAFFMGQLLGAATSRHFPSYELYAMSAKVVRRVHKLQKNSVPSDQELLTKINGTLQRASDMIARRWQTAQQKDARTLDLTTLATLDFENDTHITLPALDAHIASLQSRAGRSAPSKFEPTSSLLSHNSTALPRLPKKNPPQHHYATINLQIVESWISENIDNWILWPASSCDTLHDYIKEYHGLASEHYRNNPEAFSVMILTIFELWVACDKLAVSQCTLLAEYPPEIPLEPLENLLLPYMHQMTRLQALETYLRNRASQARGELSAFLFSTTSTRAFATRYFSSSSEHQRLREQILKEAKASKLAKQAEYRSTRAEYDRLQGLYTRASCEYRTVIVDSFCDPPVTRQEHIRDCQKCSYSRQCRALKITIHEWPLPANDSQSAAVVFELKVPNWFAAWRDARAFFLHCVLGGDRPTRAPQASYRLDPDDPHLASKLVRARFRRIGLLSQQKSVLRSHYTSKMITEVNVESVCVANGLRYEYYDSEARRYMTSFTFDLKVQKACTYTLSNPSLQRYIIRPAHKPDGEAPNLVLANQDKCPTEMSLDEFKELTTVPLGHHLQWVNILQQLAMPGVDFRKDDTTLIFLQCIYQTGPRSDHILRESHALLRDRSIAANVIANLDSAVERIKQNWESAQALSLFASIATRTLALNDAIQEVCLQTLAKIRGIAFQWVQTLRESTHTASDKSSRTIFISKSVEIAFICGSTYDVPEKYLQTLLSSARNSSILIQVSIVAQNGGHTQKSAPICVHLSRLRFTRLLYRCSKMLVAQHQSLDHAIRRSWSAYTPGRQGWDVVSEAMNDWITTNTGSHDGASMRVHYNVLSGELLVNGVPLDQPPQEYRSLDLYRTLFGDSIVEVMPSLTPGFQFSTKRMFGDYAVLIGRHVYKSGVGTELVVRASRAGSVLETLPKRLLGDSLPEDFARKYVHWYDHKSGNVEFRPIDQPWNPSSSAVWTLAKTQDSTWQLRKDANAVVGLQTSTAKAIHNVVKPLIDASQIHCIAQDRDRCLKIELSALNLSFTLSASTSLIRSKEYPSMFVDGNQALNTLIGFSNKLMLVSDSGERLLLLPEGDLIYARQQRHTAVRVSSLRNVRKVHALRLDLQLERLVDKDDLQCKLYLAYLHALTSGCLPDPLTNMTGTEQALRILSSCAVKSFSQFTQANIDTLALIAELSPGRCYYPAHAKVMQTVSWDKNLDFLSQHARLRIRVQALLDQAKKSAIFHPDNRLDFPDLEECDDGLQERDSIRSSVFRVADFGAEEHTIQYDRPYVSRDRGIGTPEATRAALISGLMTRSGSDKYSKMPTMDQLWQKLVKCSTIHGPHAGIGNIGYHYERACLDSGYMGRIVTRLPAHLHQLGESQQQQNCYTVAIWLATMAFSKYAEMEMIQLLAMSFKSAAMHVVRAPTVDVFQLDRGINRRESDVRYIVSQYTRMFERCPEFQTVRRKNERLETFQKRRRDLWQAACDAAVMKVVAALVSQFPAEQPAQIDVQGVSTYVDVDKAMERVRGLYQSWHNNNLLHDYVACLSRACNTLRATHVQLPILNKITASVKTSSRGYFTIQDIFSGFAPRMPKCPLISQTVEIEEVVDANSAEPSKPRLLALHEQLTQSAGDSVYEVSYAKDLGLSLTALRTRSSDLSATPLPTVELLIQHQDLCKSHARAIYDRLFGAFKDVQNSAPEQITQHWPRCSPSLLLGQLAHDRISRLSQSWVQGIISYGVAITAVQQANRLVAFAKSSQSTDLLNELRNHGHTNWDPQEYPESLLMEVESGIMIREVQEEIASEMRAPSSGSNAVMQLNMGEGKSTVIVPMVAAALANGKQLVRVIVAKPQSKQMAQMMISKFGGLVGRRIYYMPFSRSLSLTPAVADAIGETLQQCMSERGILLVQPEHLLSFKLMSPECYTSGKFLLGKSLMKTQDFFDQHSRDIVDESDDNFSVRFELIYTMGTQQTIESSPSRWLLLQQILEIIRNLVAGVSAKLPTSIETMSNGDGSFPRVRLFKQDATDVLIHQVAAHVCDHGLEGFQISRQTQSMRCAIFKYITEFELRDNTVRSVEQGDFWDTCQCSILLLRGLLAGGVLNFAFSQKRWRVNYGLADRSPPTKLAVPYRAKDNPSPRSEFSHPDVVIVLTSLCYYYGGLSDDDMFTTLSHLMNSDQADAEYQMWIRNLPRLPTAFRQLQGINLNDRSQCKSLLFGHLRTGKAVVDYFLSHIVFPKELKEFPHKLSASGWDIGKEKQLVTTGFSGTNDSRRLLPLYVDQLDIEKQKHTNALVMEYLLQPANSIELMPIILDKDAHLTDAEQLISIAISLDPPVQVILDVGAQILELDNLGVAKAWLKSSGSSVEAVVFVDDTDELCVIDRKDRVDYLRISPFAARLDACLIFLDESHTRGIDLQLPIHYRALVTLGASLSKDRLVQACMRMRKLGKGQTVTFCIPPEIQTKIGGNKKGETSSDITVQDVLLWSISETHTEMRRSMPLWAVQGERFIRNENIWTSMKTNGETTLTKSGCEDLLEEECQSLSDRYRPQKAVSCPDRLTNADDRELRRIANRCRDFDGLQFNSSTLQEEQERELSPEIEQERQVQKALSAEPVSHQLHPHVKDFAMSGKLKKPSSAYMPAFRSLLKSSAALVFDVEDFTKEENLLVTADFASTVKRSNNVFQLDDFQRHVNWLLTARASDTDLVTCIMIVSEYEANLLLPSMAYTASSTALHKYKARCNASYAPLDDLNLFTVSGTFTRPVLPRFLSVQLALFAGQLYISSHDDYLEICKFLGLSPKLLTTAMEDDGWKVGNDGFILKDGNGGAGGASGLSKSPMPFLKVLMSRIRRNGDGISRTDIGRLLEGKTFQESYWDT